MSDIKSLEMFVSSIKIKGLHFLPPVITAKRHIELQRFKQQAIKLERRLQTCRDLRKNLQELLVYKPFSEYNQSSESDSILETESCVGKKSDIALQGLRRKPVLSHDIIDITEYGKDGIKIIDVKLGHIDDFKCYDQCANIVDTNVQDVTNLNQENTSESPPTEICEEVLESIENKLSRHQSIIKPSSNSISPGNSDKTNCPRLIRSNSYILENPSPVLLANFEKLYQEEKIVDKLVNDNNKCTSTYIDSSYIPFENSQFSSLNTVCDTMDIRGTELSSNIDCHSLNQSEETSSPKIEVIQTDISLQHITVDCNKNTCNELEMQKSSLELVDPNYQLVEVLKSIPEDYSKKILNLIERQQIEYCKNNNADNDTSLEDDNWSPNNNNYSDFDHMSEEPTLFKSISEFSKNEKNADKASISPSQSIYYTLSSTCTVLPSSPMEIIDLETEDTQANINEIKSTETLMTYFPRDSKYQQLENCRRKLSFRQERLNKLDAEIAYIKQDWAASVIGACVKGYLTRRLLRTERVQGLVNTIKDALVCALQLHSAANIDKSDVELHRRLINQVTAACYTFHDIFFSTSVAERMSIISIDRRRLLEKAKRPASAPVPQRSRSATKLRPRTSLSQSITKV